MKYHTTSGLATEYAEARDERNVLSLERSIERRDLIVLGELGYIPLGQDGAEKLFGFFSKRYERTSVIVATNLPFSQWPQVFGDERLVVIRQLMKLRSKRPAVYRGLERRGGG